MYAQFKHFIHETAFENVVLKMSAIFFRPRYIYRDMPLGSTIFTMTDNIIAIFNVRISSTNNTDLQ